MVQQVLLCEVILGICKIVLPNQPDKLQVIDTVRGMSRLLGNAMSALVFALA